MSSARSINLDLGLGQTRSIQLGAVTQRRGVEDVNGTLFPKATVAHLVNQAEAIPLASSEVTNALFLPVNTPTLRIISDNVVYADDPLITLPYPGVCRVRASVAYRTDVQANGNLVLRINVTDSGGALDQRVAVLTNPPLTGVIELEFIAEIATVTSVIIENATNQVVYAGDQVAFGPQTVFEVEYIGVL